MTENEGLDTLLDETEGASLDVLLERLIATIPEGPDKRLRIVELVDESRAAWQWLMGGRRRGRILHLSGGWNASAIALARAWDEVVVLGSSAPALKVLERRAHALGLANIDARRFEGDGKLPFPDRSFDAVCWSAGSSRNAPCDTSEGGDDLRPLLAEAARIPIRPHTTAYPLADANRALGDLKADRINGTGILVMDG